ncbi:unnamed protein product [Cuscuta campestris]|uniref:Uncharacterized protein n=1 Tax=Cuscuta campestris TaxID=132261 RepID=A0A484L2C1_9ASTE|nr:unnamed protein product [Cuscuta campestris]
MIEQPLESSAFPTPACACAVADLLLLQPLLRAARSSGCLLESSIVDSLHSHEANWCNLVFMIVDSFSGFFSRRRTRLSG